jgi:hypothetical protein
MHLATSVSRPNLIAMGTCFGKFSKSGKFKLTITCLDWLAKYAKYKVSVWFIAAVARGWSVVRRSTRGGWRSDNRSVLSWIDKWDAVRSHVSQESVHLNFVD